MSDHRPIPDPGETAAERLARAAALPMRVALATLGGYRGRSYTIGYLKGLLHALRGRPANEPAV